MQKNINKEMIEFFCGRAEVASGFRACGFQTFTVDNRSRTGVCKPDLRADVLKIDAAVLPFTHPGVIWAAVPCNAFSNAAGNYYRDGTGYKESTKYFISLLRKTIKIIEEKLANSSPAHHLYYFIENPRASLRYNKLMIDFLARTNGTINECTLGSYGFPTTKPTDLFTNYPSLTLRPKLPYGRGAKVTGCSFNNLTQAQRQATPYELGYEIAQQLCNQVFSEKMRLEHFNAKNNSALLQSEKPTSLETITATINTAVI